MIRPWYRSRLFWLGLPGPGRYRMFLDFQVAGVVRTAEFTVVVD